jgi:hypothetical protein
MNHITRKQEHNEKKVDGDKARIATFQQNLVPKRFTHAHMKCQRQGQSWILHLGLTKVPSAVLADGDFIRQQRNLKRGAYNHG